VAQRVHSRPHIVIHLRRYRRYRLCLSILLVCPRDKVISSSSNDFFKLKFLKSSFRASAILARRRTDPNSLIEKPWNEFVVEVQETAFNTISVWHTRSQNFLQGGRMGKGEERREVEPWVRAMNGRWYRRSLARHEVAETAERGRARPRRRAPRWGPAERSVLSVAPLSRASAVSRSRSRGSVESTSRAAAKREKKRGGARYARGARAHGIGDPTGRGDTNEARND